MIHGRDVVSLDTFTPAEVRWVTALARRMKAEGHGRPLTGRVLAMVFFNPSLRTRASFSIAFGTLGGTVIDLSAGRDIWDLELREHAVMRAGPEEHVKDAVGALSRYADAIAIRALARSDDWGQARRDEVIVAFQKHASVPVFNMESALEHPCQAWGDALTLEEAFGEPRGRRLTLAWVYNPKAKPLAVPHGAAIMAAKLGLNLTISHPEGFELDPAVRDSVQRTAAATGGSVRYVRELGAAVADADVVYAASWAAPHLHGRAAEEQEARDRHMDRRITSALLSAARDARLLHAMPIRRNVEVDDAVLDGPASLVLEQAENRLHIQRALFTAVLGEASPPSPSGAR